MHVALTPAGNRVELFRLPPGGMRSLESAFSLFFARQVMRSELEARFLGLYVEDAALVDSSCRCNWHCEAWLAERGALAAEEHSALDMLSRWRTRCSDSLS